MLPGGSYLVPNIIYATNERIIVYDPYASDFNGGKVSIPYNTVVGVKLEKRPYATVAVKIETSPSGSVAGLGMIHGIVGGEDRFERSIEALPITKAEELMDAILRAIVKIASE
jgi:hypothetical protein